jgi:acetyltransferase-like isoleucine patch superfamily enzyme
MMARAMRALRSVYYRLRYPAKGIRIDGSALIGPRVRLRVEKGGKINIGGLVRVEEGARITAKACSVVVGDGARLSEYCCIRADAPLSLGAKFNAGTYSKILSYGGAITIGDSCTLQHFSILYGHGGLKIGSGVRIAAHVVVIPANHEIEDVSKPIYKQGIKGRGIEIGDGVWIGANCSILDGVSLGPECVVGAGSVVTRSMSAYSVIAGSPARVLRSRLDSRSGEAT